MKDDTESHYREESDTLGKKNIPASALWGIHTARAVENFPLAGRPVDPHLIRAYALVKKACAKTNYELNYLDGRRAEAIRNACDRILSHELDEEFPVDALQGGAGTSLNMNINEVIANQANLFLGRRPGDYGDDGVDPLAHVNLHQSTNDTFPSALKICLIELIRKLAGTTEALQGAFQEKEKAFAHIVTTGRTEWQAAVPMTLGTIFSSYSEAFGRDRWRTFKCEERLRVVNIGGTAVGTGLTAPKRYIFRVIENLRELTGYGLARAENLVDQTANSDSLVEVAGIITAHAVNLQKAARDLRFLSFTGEIKLPAVQVGSSIMPGKVNPVIPEAVIQAAMKAKADMALIAEASAGGTLQINEFLPLIADTFIEALKLLRNADIMLRSHIVLIDASPEVCGDLLDREPMVLTALIPHIGYTETAKLVTEYISTPKEERPFLRVFLEQKLDGSIIEKSFSPAALSALGYQD